MIIQLYWGEISKHCFLLLMTFVDIYLCFWLYQVFQPFASTLFFWKRYAVFYTNWWTNILLWPSSKRLVVCFQFIHGGSWSDLEVLFGNRRYSRFCCCHICQLFLTTACGSIFVPQLEWSILVFLYPICLLRAPYCFGIFIDVGKSIFLIRVRKFFVFYNFTK